MDYLSLSIAEIHEALLKKEVTPLDLVNEALDKIERNKDNAFEFVNKDKAIEKAKSLTEPEEDNLLWGIPFAVKDNFSVKDIPATASSDILKGYIPLFTATAVRKLEERGAIVIGKTTLDELAMGGTGTSGHLGKTYNPYDPSHSRMVGGSSCGSAVAVSAGIVPFALGSDTGDSVRKPASYAGLVGMKPTWGRISRFGLFPFAPSLDHVAYFTRNVDDASIILNAIAGRDEQDSTSSCRPVDDYSGDACEHKRIAVIKEIVDSVSNEDIKKSFNSGVNKLKEEGHVVDEVSFGQDMLEAIYATYFVISCAEATSNNANLDGIKFGPYQGGASYQEVMSNARTKGFGELIKRRFVIGSFALMKENQNDLFLRAQKARAKIVSRVNEILSSYDFIFAPAAPSVAPLFEAKGDKLSNEYLIADNHLALGNFAGLPSITVPLTMVDGLPVGVNFMGRAFDEKEVFAIAKAFEKASGLKDLCVLNKKEASL